MALLLARIRLQGKDDRSMKQKRIMMSLEYGCFPLWVYDEDGDLVNNGMPEELQDDGKLIGRLESLAEEFDHLFIDTKQEFRYVGFSDKQKKQDFIRRETEIWNEICEKVGNNYRLVSFLEIE